MVFIATVSEQLNRDTVVVNCRDLNITNATAKISTCSGVLPQYSIDDTVIVGLENRDSSKLVVLGSISNNKSSSSSILSSTIKVNSNVVSVNYPSIGQISTQEFSCLQNLTPDLSQYFLRKDKENSDRTNDLISINTKTKHYTNCFFLYKYLQKDEAEDAENISFYIISILNLNFCNNI